MYFSYPGVKTLAERPRTVIKQAIFSNRGFVLNQSVTDLNFDPLDFAFALFNSFRVRLTVSVKDDTELSRRSSLFK